MAVSNFYHTDTLKIVQELCAAGMPRKLAEKQTKIWNDNFKSFAEMMYSRSEQFSTKGDLEYATLSLKKEIEELRLSLQKEIEGVRLSLQKEIEEVRREIVLTQKNTIYWVAGFLIAQTGLLFTLNQLF